MYRLCYVRGICTANIMHISTGRCRSSGSHGYQSGWSLLPSSMVAYAIVAAARSTRYDVDAHHSHAQLS